MSRTFGNQYVISGTGTVSAGVTATPTQINEDFKGVSVYIPVTYDSGYSGPSDDISAYLQWSPDGGTTWLLLGNSPSPLSAKINNTFTSLLVTTGPVVALSNGVSFQESGSTVNGFANQAVVLPRTWRLALSIGALSAATYTIGDILVEYLLEN